MATMKDKPERAGPAADQGRSEPDQDRSEDAITVNIPTEYNPALDPKSPDFDPVLWKAEFKKMRDSLPEAVKENQQRIAEAVAPLFDPDYLASVTEALESAMSGAAHAAAFIAGTESSEMIDSLQNGIASAAKIAAELTTPDFLEALRAKIIELAENLPPEELEALKEELEDEDAAPLADQTSLFDEEEKKLYDLPPKLPRSFELPKDFLQLFAEPAKPEQQKPKRKRKPRFEKLVEQGMLDTILQNSTTNALTKFSSQDKVEIDRITGEATITRGDYMLTIPHYRDLKGLRTSTWQLLDSITLKFTQNPRKEKEPTVILPLTEYMQRRNLRDRKAAKEQAIEDMKILRTAGFTVTRFTKKKEKRENSSFTFINLADSGEVKDNGDIVFTFAHTFHSALLNGQIMAYPSAVMQVNNHRNPNAYYIGRKASELKNMNALHANQGDIISVKTLLENAPYIPSYEEVAATDRAFSRRIIEPFERDLNALQDAFSWEYCHENGTPLTDEELESFSFETFIECNIKITWHNYPDQTKRRETLEAKIEAAKESSGKKKRGRPKKTELHKK